MIIPLECEFFALRGVALLIETIDKVRDRLNPSITMDGLLATMYDPRTLHSREVLERVVEALRDDVLETVIGRTVKFPDASVSGVPITEFAPEHAAAQAYLRLARELVARWRCRLARSPSTRRSRRARKIRSCPSRASGSRCPTSTARSICS